LHGVCASIFSPAKAVRIKNSKATVIGLFDGSELGIALETKTVAGAN
jgi:hypothetical protein